jgi:hypothetical protein
MAGTDGMIVFVAVIVCVRSGVRSRMCVALVMRMIALPELLMTEIMLMEVEYAQ